MVRAKTMVLALCAPLLLSGCAAGSDGSDGGGSGMDAATDAGVDAGSDAGGDAGSDGGGDGGAADGGGSDAGATDGGTSTLQRECDSPQPGWIWCDDFETDRLASYFEHDDASGRFVRTASVGVGGSFGMRATFVQGQQGAGALHLAMGRTPQSYFRPVDAGTEDYTEIYWRMYLRHPRSWVGGGPAKLSRAFIFASSSTWAQAALGHVWSSACEGTNNNDDCLILDPASGTDLGGTLVTTTYNDFANLRWLGWGRGRTPIFDAAGVGTWYCIEARMKLNDPGQENGEFEFWIDDSLEALKTGLNWVGNSNTFTDYGINAVYFENYWNAGSPVDQDRFFDNIVVSTQRIGCGVP